MDLNCLQITEVEFLATKTDQSLQEYWDNMANRILIDWKNVSYNDLRKPLYSAIAYQLSAILKASGGNIPNLLGDQAALWGKNSRSASEFVRDSELLEVGTCQVNNSETQRML